MSSQQNTNSTFQQSPYSGNGLGYSQQPQQHYQCYAGNGMGYSQQQPPKPPQQTPQPPQHTPQQPHQPHSVDIVNRETIPENHPIIEKQEEPTIIKRDTTNMSEEEIKDFERLDAITELLQKEYPPHIKEEEQFWCSFCHHYQQQHGLYWDNTHLTHNTRDRFGNCSCERLRNTKCSKCGEYGHTPKYCVGKKHHKQILVINLDSDDDSDDE